MLIGEYRSEIDSKGRILLPKRFLDENGLIPGSDVVVVGLFNYIEIFSEEGWEKQTEFVDGDSVKEMLGFLSEED